MKYLLLLFMLCCAHVAQAQPKPEFLLPLYFSDAKGNKDTVFTGYDPKASAGILEFDFGEYNINKIPFDTVFDVRVGEQRFYIPTLLPSMSNVFVDQSSCDKDKASCVSTRSVIYFKCKYLPMTITWDSTLINSCHYNSFFHRRNQSAWQYTYINERSNLRDKKGKLILTKEYLRDKSKKHNNLSETQDILLSTQDTLYSMHLFLLCSKVNHYYVVGVNDITESASMKVTPNPASQSIEIAYEGNKISKGIHITDISGKSMLRSNITNDFWQKEKQTIYISAYPQGIYFLRLDFDDGTSGVQRFVKME